MARTGSRRYCRCLVGAGGPSPASRPTGQCDPAAGTPKRQLVIQLHQRLDTLRLSQTQVATQQAVPDTSQVVQGCQEPAPATPAVQEAYNQTPALLCTSLHANTTVGVAQECTIELLTDGTVTSNSMVTLISYSIV